MREGVETKISSSKLLEKTPNRNYGNRVLSGIMVFLESQLQRTRIFVSTQNDLFLVFCPVSPPACLQRVVSVEVNPGSRKGVGQYKLVISNR